MQKEPKQKQKKLPTTQVTMISSTFANILYASDFDTIIKFLSYPTCRAYSARVEWSFQQQSAILQRPKPWQNTPIQGRLESEQDGRREKLSGPRGKHSTAHSGDND